MGSEMTLREVLLADSYQQEVDALKAQLADAQAYATSAIAQRDKAEAENAEHQQKVLSLILERDQYRHQAEQKLALRREVEALLGIASEPCGDDQFAKGLERLRTVIAENAKLQKVVDACQAWGGRLPQSVADALAELEREVK